MTWDGEAVMSARWARGSGIGVGWLVVGKFYAGDLLADPAHHGDSHRVAASLVAWAVGTLVFGLTLPRDAGPVVGEALEAFAFGRGEATDCHWGKDAMLVATFLEGEHGFSWREVLNAVGFSAWPKAREEVHAIERNDRVADVRHLVACGSLEGSSSSSRRVSTSLASEVARLEGDGKSFGLDPSLVVGRRASPLGFAECYWAACLNAASSIGGSCLPLLSALRRMPAQAFGLKKNRGGNVPTSKTCDNEDATTALGYSEVLSVQDPVGPPIPELFQRPEEGTKVPSSSRRQDARDIFPDDPAGTEFVSESKKDEGEVAAGVGESFAQAGDGEGLARSSSDQKVD